MRKEWGSEQSPGEHHDTFWKSLRDYFDVWYTNFGQITTLNLNIKKNWDLR